MGNNDFAQLNNEYITTHLISPDHILDRHGVFR